MFPGESENILTGLGRVTGNYLQNMFKMKLTMQFQLQRYSEFKTSNV